MQHYISPTRTRASCAALLRLGIGHRAGSEVPFYYQRTLGGPADLRGFRQFRFRDRNLLLLQAEYRWEIFTAVDGAIFYDAGKVASRIEDLNFRDLESDYGIGFRFGTVNGVFLRVEGAFGSSGGKHFIHRDSAMCSKTNHRGTETQRKILGKLCAAVTLSAEVVFRPRAAVVH